MMKSQFKSPTIKALFWLAAVCCSSYITCAVAHDEQITQPVPHQRLLLRAARVFDGTALIKDGEVLITDNLIEAVGKSHSLESQGAVVFELGDSTILPGLIELHSHIDFKKIPQATILRHGITTARDVGGRLLPLSGGNGTLRLLTAGAILTAINGYPIPTFGKTEVATEVKNPEQARALVRQFIAGGAAVIKVALETGEEHGAPWAGEHGHGHTAHSPKPWALLSLEILTAITDETHKLGKRVSAHLGENTGVRLALEAGVDEWAHIPCEIISEALLKQAAAQKVTVIPTFDTLSHCAGLQHNAHILANAGTQFLYGAELAHPDIPWGIDAQELLFMQQFTGMTSLQVLQAATAKSGAYLGLSPLGTLTATAPADIIVVQGNPLDDFKPLEYPDLVISGGKIILNHYQDAKAF